MQSARLSASSRSRKTGGEIFPTGRGCGAEIRGVDLSRLDDRSFEVIQQAIYDHLVVLFRGQNLGNSELIALGKRFGKLGNLGAGEARWHTDMSYREKPISYAILNTVELPPASGNTYFANQYLAYDTLSDALKKRLEEKLMVHDETYNGAGQMRKGFADVTDPRRAPGAHHPIFRTHPATGKRALYLGRRRNAYLIGLPLEEGEQLLDELWAHASRPEFVAVHEWRMGDVLVWDNRCLIHRRDAFDPATRRKLHRVQIKGERPR